MKKITTILIAVIILLLPLETRATHGFGAGLLTIYVDGVPFEVWAYGGGGGDGIAHIRMRDMAYMLNGTPAQFDIRAAEDSRFNYWIVRGEPYTPTGTELQPIPGDRYVMFGSYGHFEWHGFDNYPIQTAILGIDGAVVPVPVMQDIDDMYFSLPTLAGFFGVHLSEYTISTESLNPAEFPDRSIELVDLMVRLAGQWIDREYYYSPVINEHVVNPVEIALSVHGFSDNASRHVNAAALSWSWVPADWYAMSMQNMGDGLVELTIDEGFDAYRIVVDASQQQADEITLYIGDTPHQMVRYYWQRMVRHYYAEASEYGGIVLRYVIRTGAFPLEFIPGDVAVYRSTVQGEQGERILIQENVTFSDSILYEFTDPTAEFGQVYYYSLVRITDWGTASLAPAPDIWLHQMRVDTTEILEAPVDAPTRSPVRIYVISFLLLVGSIIAIKGKKLFVRTLVLLVVLACAPIAVQATVGPFAGEQRVIVDGETFAMWGVFEDATLSHFRLQDMAYILNGTPAQFNIREIDDNRFDYWIVRGEPYTPTGNEFRPIPGIKDDDIGMLWFDGGFFGDVIIGVDGTNKPETAISFFARGDEDGFYFSVWQLAHLLGFSLDWSSTGYFFHQIHDYYVENADYVISTGAVSPAVLPIKSIEFLELMMHLTGHWVDNAHFISPTIDESIVWPVELHFDTSGISNFSWNTAAPTQRDSGGRSGLWYPLSMRYLEDGLVELTVTGAATQRIIIDTSGEYINELTYYIDDIAFHMVRMAGRQSPRRYYAEPAEDGGIRLLYVLGRTPFSSLLEELRIYRSQVRGWRGTLVFSQEEIERDDRILFEFIDTTVQRGNVYYYSIWMICPFLEREIWFTDEQWQMSVDVDAILGEEEEIVEIDKDTYTPIPKEAPSRFPWSLVVAAALLATAVVVVIWRFSKTKS